MKFSGGSWAQVSPPNFIRVRDWSNMFIAFAADSTLYLALMTPDVGTSLHVGNVEVLTYNGCTW